MKPTRLRRFLFLCALCSTTALAAPVGSEGLAPQPDPFELAERWTMASAGVMASAAPVMRAEAPRAQRLPLGLIDGTVPDPSAYALVGLGLLVAGLAAQRLTARRGRRGQRGFSKNT